MKLTDEYIYRKPEKFRSIILHLISVFEWEIPELVLLFKSGMPYFYYKKKPFCYLAPNLKKGFVDAGLPKVFN